MRAPLESITSRIYVIKRYRVTFDNDLAELCVVETHALLQVVKSNPGRFPPDFVFQISYEEIERWRSQIVISKSGARIGLQCPP